MKKNLNIKKLIINKAKSYLNYVKINKKWTYIVIFIIITRILFIFYPGNVFDIPELFYMGQRLLAHQNPYLISYPYYWDSSKYPPFLFFIYSGAVLLMGNTIFGIHSIAIIFDLLSILFIFKIAKMIWSEKTAKIAVILWSLSPMVILQDLLGQNDLIVVFFILATIYYYFKGRKTISAVLLGLGIMVKYVPLFLAIPIIVDLFKKNNMRKKGRFQYFLKNLIEYFGIAILTILFVMSPFLISDYHSIINSVLQFGSKTTNAMSFAALFSFFMAVQYNFFGILNISLSMIVEIIVFLIILLILLRSNQHIDNLKFLKIIAIVFTVLTLFSYDVMARNILWYFPIIVMLISSKIKRNNFDKIQNFDDLQNINTLNDQNSDFFKETNKEVNHKHEDSIDLENNAQIAKKELSEKNGNKRIRSPEKFLKIIIIYLISIIAISLALILYDLFRFNLTSFNNPLVEVNLNWSINPTASFLTQQYFLLLDILIVVSIVFFYLISRQILDSKQNFVMLLAGIYGVQSWIYYMSFKLFYFNLHYYFAEFNTNPFNFIVTMSSFLFVIFVDLYLLGYYITRFMKKQHTYLIKKKISVFLNKLRAFMFPFESEKILGDEKSIITRKKRGKRLRYNFKKFKITVIEFLKIFAAPIILRLILVFFPFNPLDSHIIYYSGTSIISGFIPYKDFGINSLVFPGSLTHPHPPLFYYICALPVLLSGENYGISVIYFKFYFLIAEIISMYFVYLIALEFVDKKKAQLIILIYGLIPITYFMVGFLGVQETNSAALLSAGIYFYIKKRYVISSILLSLGFLDTIFTAFIFVILLFRLLLLKNYRSFFKYLIGFLSIIVLFSIPFLIICPNQYISTMKLILNYDTSISFAPYLFPRFFDAIIFTIPFIGLNISIKFIFMILLYLFILILPWKIFKLYNNKLKKNDPSNIISIIFIFMVLIAIIFRSVHFRLIIWSLPYLMIFIISKIKITDDFDKILQNSLIRFFLLAIVLNILFVVMQFLFPNNNDQVGILYFQTFSWFLLFSTVWFINNLYSLFKLRKVKIIGGTSSFMILYTYLYSFSVCTFIIFNITLEHVPALLGYIAAPIMIFFSIIWLIQMRKLLKLPKNENKPEILIEIYEK